MGLNWCFVLLATALLPETDHENNYVADSSCIFINLYSEFVITKMKWLGDFLRSEALGNMSELVYIYFDITHIIAELSSIFSQKQVFPLVDNYFPWTARDSIPWHGFTICNHIFCIISMNYTRLSISSSTGPSISTYRSVQRTVLPPDRLQPDLIQIQAGSCLHGPHWADRPTTWTNFHKQHTIFHQHRNWMRRPSSTVPGQYAEMGGSVSRMMMK